MTAATIPLSSCTFRFSNWFQWVLDAHRAGTGTGTAPGRGLSRADILFVLELCDALEPMRKALAAEEGRQQL